MPRNGTGAPRQTTGAESLFVGLGDRSLDGKAYRRKGGTGDLEYSRFENGEEEGGEKADGTTNSQGTRVQTAYAWLRPVSFLAHMSVAVTAVSTWSRCVQKRRRSSRSVRLCDDTPCDNTLL